MDSPYSKKKKNKCYFMLFCKKYKIQYGCYIEMSYIKCRKNIFKGCFEHI